MQSAPRAPRKAPNHRISPPAGGDQATRLDCASASALDPNSLRAILRRAIQKVSVKPFQRLAVSKGRAFGRSSQRAKSLAISAFLESLKTFFQEKKVFKRWKRKQHYSRKSPSEAFPTRLIQVVEISARFPNNPIEIPQKKRSRHSSDEKAPPALFLL